MKPYAGVAGSDHRLSKKAGHPTSQAPGEPVRALPKSAHAGETTETDRSCAARQARPGPAAGAGSGRKMPITLECLAARFLEVHNRL